MSALRELIASFGIEVDDKALGHFEEKLESGMEKLQKFARVAAGAFMLREAGEFVHQTIEMGAQLGDLSERLGLGVVELQKFQFAASQGGVGAEEASNALGFLNKNLGLAATGNAEAAQAFKDLHVEIKDGQGKLRPASDIVLEVGDGLEHMGSQAERTAAVMKIFGRQGGALLPMFKEGSKEIRELYKEFDDLGIALDEDFVKGAKAADDEMAKMGFAFKGLRAQIVMALLPGIKSIVSKFTHFIGAMVKVGKETNIFKVALMALGTAGAVKLLQLAGPLLKILGLTTSTKGGILGMLSNLLKLGLPLLIIGALVLIFEDLYTMVTGGKSVIGDFLDEFGGVGEKEKLIESLKGAFEELKVAGKQLLPPLIEFGKVLLQAFVGAMPVIVLVVKLIGSAVALLAGAVSSIAQLPDAIKNGDFSKIGKTIDKAGDAVFGKGGFFDQTTTNGPGMAESGFGGPQMTHEQFMAAQAAQASIPKGQAGGAGGKTNVVTQTNKVEIKIDGSKDPKATADEVKKNLGDTFDQQRRAALAATGG